jgi:hypothetical protein
MTKAKLFIIFISAGILLGAISSFLFQKKQPIVDKHSVFIGIHSSHSKSTSKEKNVFKDALDFNPHLISIDVSWEAFFPNTWTRKSIKEKSIPVIRWSPLYEHNEEEFAFTTITEGLWDDYLIEWANEAKKFEFTLFINFTPGIYSKDYKWSILQDPTVAQNYKKAFQYVVKLFKDEGAYNVLWIYECEVISTIKKDWIHPKLAYPGPEYTDWIAIRGENYGDTKAWSSWKNAERLFGDSIEEIDLMAPDTPIILTGLKTVKSRNENALTWYMNIPLFLESSLKRVNAILFTDSSQIPNAILSNYKNHDIFNVNINSISQTNVFKETSISTIESSTKEKNIDGSLKDWSENSFTVSDKRNVIIQGAHYWESKADFSTHVSWDATQTALYFAIKVIDDTPILKSNVDTPFENGDSIEILFGSKTDIQENVDADSLIHLAIKTQKQEKAQLFNSKKNKAINDSSIKLRKLKDHYLLEGKIPWSELTPFTYDNLENFEIIMLFNDSDHRLQKYPTKMRASFEK